MNGIFHKIGIRAGTADVMKALTTQPGLAGWWTRQVEGTFTEGASAVGDAIQFRFGDKGGFDMQVTDVAADRLLWKCTDGPEDWIGSVVDFNLKAVKGSDGALITIVYFRHQDWRTESEFTAHCSMKWATFLLSLRSLVEEGRGRPAPDDLKIDDWN